MGIFWKLEAQGLCPLALKKWECITLEPSKSRTEACYPELTLVGWLEASAICIRNEIFSFKSRNPDC